MPHAASLELLAPVLAYHRKTRTLPLLISTLFSVLSTLDSSKPYADIGHGPLLSTSWLASLEKALSSSLGVQAQISEVLNLVQGSMLAVMEGAAVERSVVSDGLPGDDGRKKKKRKLDAGQPVGQGPVSPRTKSCDLSLASRLVSTVLRGLLPLITSQLPGPLLASLHTILKSLQDKVASVLVAAGLEGSGSLHEMALIAGLRISGELPGLTGVSGPGLDDLTERLSDKAMGQEARFETVSRFVCPENAVFRLIGFLRFAVSCRCPRTSRPTRSSARPSSSRSPSRATISQPGLATSATWTDDPTRNERSVSPFGRCSRRAV